MQDKHGQTPLHWASKSRRNDATRHLLKTATGRASTLQGDNRGWTPLHVACATGTADIAEKLLGVEKGRAAITQKTLQSGDTPLHFVGRYRKGAASQSILELILNVTGGKEALLSKNNHGETPLDIAQALGRATLCKKMREGATKGNQNAKKNAEIKDGGAEANSSQATTADKKDNATKNTDAETPSPGISAAKKEHDADPEVHGPKSSVAAKKGAAKKTGKEKPKTSSGVDDVEGAQSAQEQAAAQVDTGV